MIIAMTTAEQITALSLILSAIAGAVALIVIACGKRK